MKVLMILFVVMPILFLTTCQSLIQTKIQIQIPVKPVIEKITWVDKDGMLSLSKADYRKLEKYIIDCERYTNDLLAILRVYDHKGINDGKNGFTNKNNQKKTKP